MVGERLGDSIVKWEWDEVCGGIWVGWVDPYYSSILMPCGCNVLSKAIQYDSRFLML